ncbi:gibberellin-regulated protein 6 [Senna tora]|uniref:Gibberellin-regulated protein 6 n=1 Tax=Senna tora TaxID=362788 RepID=A0A834X4H7_9FABA|nr:gibberellin-regulated protein 6 [Senna tora]
MALMPKLVCVVFLAFILAISISTTQVMANQGNYGPRSLNSFRKY